MVDLENEEDPLKTKVELVRTVEHFILDNVIYYVKILCCHGGV